MMRGRPALLALLALAVAAPGYGQAPPAAAPAGKQCESARRKVDREQKALAATQESIAHDQHAREGCTPRSVCARYETAISDAQRRVARREARLVRYRDEASEACKAD
ncbi:MAG: hypothetical protein ABI624_24270 [Casimicrobiaceae bacterium]